MCELDPNLESRSVGSIRTITGGNQKRPKILSLLFNEECDHKLAESVEAVSSRAPA